jgi:flagellar basal body-associated protein FliL
MSHAEPKPAAEEGGKPGKPLLKKIKVLGIIATVVILQCFIISAFLPSGDEPKAHASTKHDAPAHDAPAHEEDHHEGAAESEQCEVDLGAFSLTVFNPNTSSNLLVDFHLFGMVAGTASASGGEKEAGEHGHGEKTESSATGDAGKLEGLLKKNKHRFRDQIIIIVRNAQLADLTDPGLGLIKRQILTKTNALLGEPLLKGVVFSDFVVVEQ